MRNVLAFNYKVETRGENATPQGIKPDNAKLIG